jgi:hypothetical protein
MKVTFKRTGERRYGVFVEREKAPDVVMHSAPGYDEFLPHDLLHFVAEAEWGLDGAVFGQLASGGDAGTFSPIDRTLAGKWHRRRKRLRKPHKGPRRSELLTGVLARAWYARHGRGRLPSDWGERLARARVEPERLEAVVASLDRLAKRWHKLQIGGSITLEWPRPEGRKPTAYAQPERRAPRRRPRATH